MSDEGPRPHGNKPIPLPPEFTDPLVITLRERHPGLQPNETLMVSGEMAQGHSLVRLELEDPKQTSRLWFEGVVENERNNIDSPVEARDLAVDCVDALIEAFLVNARSVRFVPDWKELEDGGTTFLVRGEWTNPKLVSEADALLAEHGFDANGDPV